MQNFPTDNIHAKFKESCYAVGAEDCALSCQSQKNLHASDTDGTMPGNLRV